MIEPHLDAIAVLCRQYGVSRREIFGSAIRSDFEPSRSDVDFFVMFAPHPITGSFKRYMGLKLDLESLLDRPVDLIEPATITNQFFREATSERRVVYAA